MREAKKTKVLSAKLRACKIESQKLKVLKLSKDERKIVLLLQNEGMTIDEVSKITKLPISNLFGAISNLELKGIIKNKDGKINIVI